MWDVISRTQCALLRKPTHVEKDNHLTAKTIAHIYIFASVIYIQAAVALYLCKLLPSINQNWEEIQIAILLHPNITKGEAK